MVIDRRKVGKRKKKASKKFRKAFGLRRSLDLVNISEKVRSEHLLRTLKQKARDLSAPSY